MLDRSHLFDPELIGRLSGRGIAGVPTHQPRRGVHQVVHRGASLEFSEHTEYAPGDDLKHLDWRVFAKSDRYFVKRYEDERLQRVVFVVDGSGSMRYGEEDDSLVGSKYHFACRITVAVATVLLRQGDAVGVCVASARDRWVDPRPGIGQLEPLMEVLGTATVGGDGRIAEGMDRAANRCGKRSVLFGLSDFLDQEEGVEFMVRSLRARTAAVRLIHLMHPDEIDLPFENVARFLGMEDDGETVADPEAVRDAYREEIEEMVGTVSRSASAMGAPHLFLPMSSDIGLALAGFLAGVGRE